MRKYLYENRNTTRILHGAGTWREPSPRSSTGAGRNGEIRKSRPSIAQRVRGFSLSWLCPTTRSARPGLTPARPELPRDAPWKNYRKAPGSIPDGNSLSFCNLGSLREALCK